MFFKVIPSCFCCTMSPSNMQICLVLLFALLSCVLCEISVVEQRYVSKKNRETGSARLSEALVDQTEQLDDVLQGGDPMQLTEFPPLHQTVETLMADKAVQTDLGLSSALIKTVRASNTFGTLLTKSLISDNENTVISPLSLAVGFGMLFIGSNGDTKQELARVLQYTANDLSTEEVLRAFYDITSLVAVKSSGFQLATARAIFLQNQFNINPQYRQAMINSFGAAVRLVDFAENSAKATKAVNAWVKKSSKGIFPSLLDGDISPQTKMLLLNAVYFKGFWEKPFSIRATFNSSFFNDGTERKKISMMYQRGHYKTLDYEPWNVKFVEIPYEGGETTMILALPRAFDGLGDLLSKIDMDKVVDLLPTFENISMDLYIPKFDVGMSYNLKTYLQRMGMTNVFQEGVADLKGISPTGKLALSDVVHKARVLVDERGTEATAITTLALIPYSEYPVFNANHPFLFFMIHKPTNAVLFSGKILRL